MAIKYDLHMHTKYSDGKSTMEENVLEAIKKDLDMIAITDHGPGHIFYGIKEKDILKLRKEVDLLQEKYPEIQILLGIEANILSIDGSIDLTDMIKENIDVLLAGYHFGSKPKNVFVDMKIHIYNILGLKINYFKNKIKKANTQMLVNAMRKNNIDVLTHPGDKGSVDIDQVAKVAAETDTKLEINERHTHLTVEEINIAMKYNVEFIISSDAHYHEHIGVYDDAIKRVNEAGLDRSRVVNYKGDHNGIRNY
jgi:putative hydrolase